MENRLNRYVNLSFLLVDDFLEFRHSLKNMVEAMGAKHIDLAGNGREALELYSKHRHDILLLDYNLGEGMNGLQMLDELMFAETLRHDTIVILVTGETSMEMVQGAIDLGPDDYLPKPFTKATLKARLDRAFEKNQMLKPVLEQMNNRDYLRAIKACDQLTANRVKAGMAIQRHKADCYLRLGKPNSAMAIYANILIKRELPWALLGRARCKVHCSMYFEAIEDLNKIIESQPYAVAAYDQKAECLMAVGQYEKAFKVLQKAVAISCDSLTRQRILASLADRYNALSTALTAKRRVVSLSRHLSRKQPDDYFSLAQTLSLIHHHKKGPDGRRAISELSRLVKSLEIEFPGDIQVEIGTLLHQAIVEYAGGQGPQGDRKVKAVYQKLNDLPDPLKPFLVSEVNFANKLYADHETVAKLYANYGIPPGLQPAQGKPEKAHAFNQQGKKKFFDKDFEGAYAAFKTAFLNASDNINIALNLLQVMVKLITLGQSKPEFGELLVLSAKAFEEVSNTDQRLSHFKLLYKNIRAHMLSVSAPSNQPQEQQSHGPF